MNSMGNINDKLITCTQWPTSAWYKDRKILTEEKTEVVSITVSGRDTSVLCSEDSIYVEMICDMSRIACDFEMSVISEIFCNCWKT